MSDITIRVEGLGKRYYIGHQRSRSQYKALRDTLTDALAAPFRRAAKLLRGVATGAAELDEALWALDDISFEVKRGEAVGIIGRNGAGKTTLLKILSRITEPTKGYAEIRGRVGSLLEVGAGFHPELTGRENIYLNGAILGMKRREIKRKFDEIVAFAEVEKFIDTPVKHFSSGMYLRLAFAVAAHLETEILLVDEVLAVGDIRFQRKCLSRMQVIGKQGRTVLFVSHNMSAITRLCGRIVLLDGGRVQADGPSHEVVSTYLKSDLGTTAAREWSEVRKAPGGEIARLRAVRVRAEDGRITGAVDIRRPLQVEMEYEVLQPGYELLPRFHFFTSEGVHAFVAIDHDPVWRRRTRPAGRYVSRAWVPGNFLSEGMLVVGAGLTTLNPVIVQFQEMDAVAFQVIDTMDGDSARGDWTGPMKTVVRPLLKWSTSFSSDGTGDKNYQGSSVSTSGVTAT